MSSSRPTSAHAHISRPQTADAMHAALVRLATLRPHLALLADDDDPVLILQDAVEEVLQHRAAIEDVRQYMHGWLERTKRR